MDVEDESEEEEQEELKEATLDKKSQHSRKSETESLNADDILQQRKQEL